VKGEHQLFGFLTTEANDVVGAIHPKAMPVILTKQDELEQWMTAPAEDALKLQRPLPDGALKIVATGERKDDAA
jgi:putative SOS response-associated peptidase YedK